MKELEKIADSNGELLEIVDAEAREDISEIKQSLSDLIPLEKTASGTIVTFDDGSELPIPSLKVSIEAVQSGSGDPSPDNIRPISGWSDVNVTVADATINPTISNTYTINLDRTRYGGTLDVVSGVLTVDREYVDLGTLNYSYYSGNLFTVRISDLKPVSNDKLCNALCSIYTAKRGNEYASIDGSFVAGFNNSSVLAIHDSRFTDATAFKTAMNGVQLVYELATPQTYQLTPTQINSLLGTNNIWADTGDLEMIYFVNNSLVQAIYDMINVLNS